MATTGLKPPTNLVAVASSSLTAAPTITTSTLPSATVGQPYSATLQATGGLAPYTWSLNDGALPTGLTLSTSGLISGTPTVAGSFKFDVLVTEAIKQVGSLSLNMVH